VIDIHEPYREAPSSPAAIGRRSLNRDDERRVKNMKKVTARLIVVAVSALLGFVGVAQAGTLISENFDANTNWPTGWATTNGTYWAVLTPFWPVVAAHSGTNVALFNSFSLTSGVSALLSTPTLDLTGYSSVSYSFWMYHDTGYEGELDRIIPQISTNGGSSWSDLSAAINRYDGTNQWEQVTFDLASYIGDSNVKLGFDAISEFGNNMFIDDVSVTTNGASVPEPAALTLVLLGLAPLLLRRRRA
jgi:MYXO-CTERM domain-containing protein